MLFQSVLPLHVLSHLLNRRPELDEPPWYWCAICSSGEASCVLYGSPAKAQKGETVVNTAHEVAVSSCLALTLFVLRRSSNSSLAGCAMTLSMMPADSNAKGASPWQETLEQ